MVQKHYFLPRANAKALRLLAFFFVFFCTVAVHAEDRDYGDLELGKTYAFDVYSSVSGKFTAPKDGVLLVSHSSGIFVRVYSDEEHKNEIVCQREFDSEGRISYELEVTTGQVLYFYEDFSMSAGSFTLTMYDGSEELLLNGVTPQEGSTFTIAGEPQILFKFSSNVKIDGAEIVCGDNAQSVRADVKGSSVLVLPKSVLYGLLKSGELNSGETFTVRLRNVRMEKIEDNLYGTDGTCEASFVSASKPVELVKAGGLLASGNPFLSYWNKGDENGIIRAEFDGPLQVPEAGSTDQIVTLTYGDIESSGGDYYVETQPYTVEGNTLICDLTGKLRLPSDMLHSGTEYPKISVKIEGVRGEDGSYAYTENSGSVGSFGYSLDYKKVSVNITAYFTPESGTSLKGVEQIELWIRKDYEKIMYDGILFTYLEDGVEKSLVSQDFEAKPDADTEGAYIILINVPDAVAGKQNITVSLNNLLSADGADYTEKLTAKYDFEDEGVAFVANPANGSKVDALSEVELTFPNETVVSLNTSAGQLTLTKEGGQPVALPEATLATEALNVVLLHTASPVTEQGIYTIDIPAGYVLNSAWEAMPAMKLVYGVGVETGITQIVSDAAGAYAVYTVDGKRVSKPLSDLPAGLYIVNGKKVVIK